MNAALGSTGNYECKNWKKSYKKDSKKVLTAAILHDAFCHFARRITINKVEFKAKNLTSNAGLLLLFNYSKSEGIFDLIESEVDFENRYTDKIKMNHIKAILGGNFIGIDKLERLKLLQNDPLVREFGVNIIDIDSTVINVEGHQEGTAKGYNPKKPGNRCYTPLWLSAMN